MLAMLIPNRMKNDNGFTLIEVLVALLIIAVALTATLYSTIQSTRATNHVRDNMIAHWVGMNVLSQIQTGIITLPRDGNVPPGKTHMLGRDWYWSVDAHSEDTAHLFSIAVEVRDQDKHLRNRVEGYAEI